MSRRATLRLLLLGLLLCWCGVFLRSENTEKSIVRALLLEQTPLKNLGDSRIRVKISVQIFQLR